MTTVTTTQLYLPQLIVSPPPATATPTVTPTVTETPTATPTPTATAFPINWLQFDGGPEHSGNNTQERVIRAANVANLVLIFQVTLPSLVDGAPVYLTGVSTPSGTRDLLFMTATDGTLLALDAHSGAQVWIAPHPVGSCVLFDGKTPCFTTSSPAVDPSLQYVYTYALDGYAHKHRVGDGSEVTGNGWPVQVTLRPNLEKGSSALSIVTTASGASYLYMTNAAYPSVEGDGGYAYQGHLTAINLADASTHVFNAACSNRTGLQVPGSGACNPVGLGVWARPGTIYDPDTGKLYIATGNGNFAPGSYAWGDSVLALNPDGTGSGSLPLDSYTPVDQQQLNISDTDLGSDRACHSAGPDQQPGAAPGCAGWQGWAAALAQPR